MLVPPRLGCACAASPCGGPALGEGRLGPRPARLPPRGGLPPHSSLVTPRPKKTVPLLHTLSYLHGSFPDSQAAHNVLDGLSTPGVEAEGILAAPSRHRGARRRTPRRRSGAGGTRLPGCAGAVQGHAAVGHAICPPPSPGSSHFESMSLGPDPCPQRGVRCVVWASTTACGPQSAHAGLAGWVVCHLL